jgi:uncharacterized GH25 family protein
MYLFVTCVVLFGLVASATGAHAHTMYCQVTDYVPNLKWSTKMYLWWGHHFPLDDAIGAEWLDKCQIVSPDGSVKDLPVPEEFLTKVELTEPGTYIVASQLKGGFFTMYMKDGEMQHASEPKTGLENVMMSMHFDQWAKAIFNADGMTDSFSKVLGHKMEIVPLKNPATVGVGDYLPLQVLFDGRPISGYPVMHATYVGFSTEEAFAYSCNVSHGQASLKILHDGIWLVKVDLEQPAPAELADKCDTMHYTATLTFEVGRVPEAAAAGPAGH